MAVLPPLPPRLRGLQRRASGVVRRSRLRRLRRPARALSARPLVLCYHAVSDGWPHALAVGAEGLERQVRGCLGRGYRPARAQDVVAGRGRLLHVTFDDAFRSVEAALPLLARLGVPVSVFACTSYADDGRPLDVPELAEQTRRYPEELATMTWETLRRIADEGVDVGSHTVSHPHLPRLGDGELRRELRESRERLEDELGRPCRFAAYPFGDEDERVRRAARAAGYEAAFALPLDWTSPHLDDFARYAIPRVGLYRRDARLRTALKTSTAVARARRRFRAPAPG